MYKKNHYTGQLKIPFSVQNFILLLAFTFVAIMMSKNFNPVFSFMEKSDYELTKKGRFYCIETVAAEVTVTVYERKKPVTGSVVNTNNKPENDKNVSQKAGSADCNQSNRMFQPIIEKAAKQYQVEPAIIKAIIMAESSFNPKAVSHKGARGLMQLMPRTAEYLGVKDSFNPEHNIDGGVRYFKRLLDKFDGDVKLALAAYNAGSRNVLKYNGVPPFKATKIYINKVLQYYENYKAA